MLRCQLNNVLLQGLVSKKESRKALLTVICKTIVVKLHT